MKKWLSALVGIVVLLGGAAIIVPGMIDWQAYQKPAVTMIEDMTGYRVRVDGDVRVRLLPYPAVAVGQVDVTIPDTDAPPVFRARGVSASLALFPLFTGQVRVHGITLKDPEISIARKKDGQIDLPPKIKQMMEGSGRGSSSNNITIQSIQIQNGQIHFIDNAQENTHKVEKLNFDLALSDLTGPYRAQGDAVYNGVPVDVNAHVGDMADPLADVRADIQLNFPDHDTRLSFDGMISRRADGDAQGTLRVAGSKIDALARALGGKSITLPSGQIDLTTLLSATPRNLVLDQIKLNYNGASLGGNVKIRLPDHDFPRPAIEASLSSKNIIDIRPFMTAMPRGKKNGTAGAPADMGVDLTIEWTAQGIQIGPEAIKDITLTLVTEKNEMRGKIRAGSVPGNGRIDVTLQPRGKSTTAFDFAATISNPIKFIEKGLGFAAPSGMTPETFKDMSITSRGTYEMPMHAAIDSGAVDFAGGKFSFDGSDYNANGKEPLATLRLTGPRLDADAWVPKPTKSAAPKNIKEAIKTSLSSLALSMDLDAKASFDTVSWQKKNIRDVVVAARLNGKKFTLSQLKIGDMDGMAITGQGTVNDVSAASGINGSVTVIAADGPAMVKQYLPAWSASVPKGTLAVNAAYKGNLDQAQVDLGVKLSNLNIRASGPVTDPLGAPKMDQVRVAFSAPDAGQAIRLIQPGFHASGPLAAPLDINADATIKNNQYGLKNINGRIAGMTVKGDISADMTGTRPKFSGGLTLGQVPLDAWMGASQNNSAAGSGPRWSSEPIQTDWMRAFDVDMAIKADRVTYHLWSLGDVGMGINLASGQMTVSDIRAKIFGGMMTGAATLAASAPRAPLQISGQMTLNDFNAASVTNAFVGKTLNRVDGKMGMDLDIKAAGASPADIVSSLSGSANTRGQDISVNGIDVSKLVAWLSTDLKPTTTIQGLTDSFMGTGATVFDTHKGLYTIKNGTIVLDQMMFDGVEARLDTSGSVDVPTWRMDTKTTLSVKNPANVPPLTFTLRGPIDRPAQNMVGNLFENYLQRELGKRVNKIIEKKLGNKLNDLGLGGILESALPGVAAPAPASTNNPAPSESSGQAPEVAPPPASPAPKKLDDIKPEDVLIDVLKGLGQ